MADRAMRIKYQTAFENFVVTLLDDRLEVAKPGFLGGLLDDKQIYYDEIVAVYRYKIPDWRVLAIILLILIIAGPIGAGFFFGSNATGAGILVWSVGLLLIALNIYRGFIRQKTMVRVIAVNDMAEFVCNQALFFDSFLSRLKVINLYSPPADSPPAQPAVAEEPPHSPPAESS